MQSPEYAILSSEAEPGRFPWSPGGQLEPENGAPPAESPPVESAPVESAPAGQSAPPAETEPAEGEEFNPFETESAGETVETEGAESPGADMPAGPALPWWTIGLLAALAAAAVALTVTLIIRRRRAGRRGVLEVTELPFNGAAAVPAVGKLHAQGARSSQQDSFSVSQAELYPSHGLLAAVADGMGGLADGDRVSQEAVRAVMSSFLELPRGEAPQTGLLRLLADANGAVNRLLGFDRLGQCGSTLLLGLVRDGAFHFLSVGDSRIYLWREGALIQLNREHVFRRDLELRAVNGEGSLAEAQTHPKAAGLTSFLGMGQLRHIDLPDTPVEIRPGDRFALLSDGVYNALSSAELAGALALGAQEAADELGRLIEARAWPGQDNYTAVIIQC